MSPSRLETKGGDRWSSPDAPDAARWLSLAAAPTFAILAGATSLTQGAQPDLLCLAAHASPLNGMALMYALMSAFHAGPWLKRIAGFRPA